MNDGKFYYRVVSFVPDPVRGEFINVAVIVLDISKAPPEDAPREVRVFALDDFTAKKRLNGLRARLNEPDPMEKVLLGVLEEVRAITSMAGVMRMETCGDESLVALTDWQRVAPDRVDTLLQDLCGDIR